MGTERAHAGVRTKTLLTDIGPVDIAVPRDREGTFTPTIVPKSKRRLGGDRRTGAVAVARRLTTGDIDAHLDDGHLDDEHLDAGHGATVSPDPIGHWTARTR